MDRRDTLYVGDAGNNRVVHFLNAAAIAFVDFAAYLSEATALHAATRSSSALTVRP